MMSSKERVQDISFLLFLVPFVVSGVYAIYLWAVTGISALLPTNVFLQVTESPYVFLIGFVAVMAGVVLDVKSEDESSRRQKLFAESARLQTLAVIALVLGALSAWYAAGFDPGAAASVFIQGRYVVVFPVLLIAFSFLILPSVGFKPKQAQYIILLIFVLGIPVAIDEVGKKNFFGGMLIGLALLVLAVYTYFRVQGEKSDSSAKAK